jgi:hypothetical protein
MTKKYFLQQSADNWAIKSLTGPIDSGQTVFDSRLIAAGSAIPSNFDQVVPNFQGAVVKAMPDGSIEGYGILFTDKKSPDLLKEYFTKSTDLFLEPDQTEFDIPIVLYNHGLDPVLKSRKLASSGAQAKVDNHGVWFKLQLNLRDKYEKSIHEMAELGKLGFSTGSTPHLAAKKSMDNGTNEITAWPIVELSLTPWPVEVRAAAGVPTVKAFGELLDSMDLRDNVLKSIIPSEALTELPDDCYLYVEPGGHFDAVKSITTPQRLRHFLAASASGEYDGAHVQEALKAIPMAAFPQSELDKVARKARAIARSLGIEIKSVGKFHSEVSRLLEEHCAWKHYSRDNVVKAVAVSALTSTTVIEEVLTGATEPTGPQILAFAKALNADFDFLSELVNQHRPQRTIKGLFEDRLAKEGHKTWELWSVLSKVVSQVVTAAKAIELTSSEYDWEAAIDEAIGEYAPRLAATIKNQIEYHLTSSDCDYQFYLRSLSDPTAEDFFNMKGVVLEDHIAVAINAFNSISDRMIAQGGQSLKAGRALSVANAKLYAEHLDEIEARTKKMRAHLATMTGVDTEKVKQGRERVKMLAEFHERELNLLEA